MQHFLNKEAQRRYLAHHKLHTFAMLACQASLCTLVHTHQEYVTSLLLQPTTSSDTPAIDELLDFLKFDNSAIV